MNKNMRKFLPYYKPYIGFVVVDLFCAALCTLCELFFPLVVRFITTAATNGTLVISSVLIVGGIYLGLRVIDVAANYFMTYIGHVTGTRLETDMRHDLFAHLQKLSFTYFDDTKVGQIMARITSDLFDITEFAHHCPEEFFIAGIKIIGSFIILSQINIWLTLIIFASLPLMVLVAMAFRNRMKVAFKRQRQQVGELNSIVEDSLLGIRVVKSFANEDVEQEKFDKGNSIFYEAKKTAYGYMAKFHASTRIFDALMYVVGIVVGSIFLINGAITGADLVAYILYISTLLATVRTIIEFMEQFQRGITGIERFLEIVEQPIEIEDAPNAIELTTVKGDISFNHISFKYNDTTNIVLNGINIDVHRGENVAIVGTSGSGKTTLCNLLPRFYELNEGTITIDGIDIKNITQRSLRKQIGIVQQDVYLFSGTVIDNILYGKIGASREEAVEAAKKAGADAFIRGLPKGYNTYVGERGVKLSGGEKQRISIARLFLKDPPILILDEATSALDNESELLVQQSLEKLSKNRTTLTIAHRLTTIRNATRIIVLTPQGIGEMGTHSELIKLDGIYAKFYKMYT